MSRPLQRRPSSVEPTDILGSKAEDALRAGKFKEAIELLKPLIKQDPRPEWRDRLGDAYLGRAKALAAKGMIKEAVGVLDNAVAVHGTCRQPVFLLQCLIRLGRFEQALMEAVAFIGAGSMAVGDGPAVSGLAAALSLAFPIDLGSPADERSPRAQWTGNAKAARDALNAWIDGKTEDEIDPLLARISLRSPFKPVRLIVKALLCLPHDMARARHFLEGVEPRSPFAPLKAAVLAALPGEPEEVVSALSLATPPQRAFTVEITGGDRDSSPLLARLLEAERAGPNALFSFLLKQAAHLPSAETRAACLNLLPRLPDQIAPFERAFGPLPDREKNRVMALAAEAGGRWHRAETHWCKAAVLFVEEGSREAKLSAGAIYRHLAQFAPKHPDIEGEDDDLGPVASYLKKSLAADPDHLPALLQLMDAYREEGEDKEWHALCEEAARRFPQESAVLLRAIDSAAARKAYKKAAGFAQRLLALDPINQPARQRMIDLQIAQVRKQIRAKRPDLAWKELATAEQWQAAGSLSAALRINQGLVGLRLDQGAGAEARLRDGVAMAGGSVVGWFRAALQEALLMPPRQAHSPIIRDELQRVLRLKPDKAQVAAIVTALNASDVRADPKATHELCRKFGLWMNNATDLEIPVAEFHALAEVLLRAQAYDLLAAFARASKRREPDEPAWRFYEIVGRTQNNPDWMEMREADALADMQGKAAGPRDFPWFNRIQRYLDSSGDDPAAKRRARRLSSASASSGPEELIMGVLGQMLQDISPQDVKRMIKKHGKERAGTILRERLETSPLGALIPPETLDMVARHLVDTAEGYSDFPV